MIKLLLTAFFAGATAIDSGADAGRSLIEQQARAVQSIDHFEVSHQVDITSFTSKLKETTHSYVKTWISRPGHLRAESQYRAQSMTIVSAGSATGFYNGGDGTYWKQPGPAPAALFDNAFPGLARRLSDVNLPAEMTSAEIAFTEPLPVAGRSFLCDVVEVRVQPGASQGTLVNNSLRLWVSREYKVPLKVQAQFVGAAGGTPQEYVDYVTEFQPNLAIPASIWEFQPPKNSKPRPEAFTAPR